MHTLYIKGPVDAATIGTSGVKSLTSGGSAGHNGGSCWNDASRFNPLTTTTKAFDAAIIGGGIIGMLTARELHDAGLSVVLLERRHSGRESSWAGGGIISPLYPWRYHDAVTRLARWSQDHYPVLADGLARVTGIDPQWTCNGLLILAPDEEADALAWSRRRQEPLQIISDRDIRELEPALADPPRSGIWLPQVAQIRNPRLARALRQDLLQRGGILREDLEARRILRHRDRISGIDTDQGRIDAGQVIVCAGAWSGALLADLGIELAVEPVMGQMILFRARPGLISRITLQQDRYAIPRRDGRVLFGSTLEWNAFHKQTTRAAREELATIARRMFPALEEYPIEHHWAGLRPGSPEGIPFITPVDEVRGLFVNTGHFRNGVVLGPASARLMADMVLQRPSIVSAAPYALKAARKPGNC